MKMYKYYHNLGPWNNIYMTFCLLDILHQMGQDPIRRRFTLCEHSSCYLSSNLSWRYTSVTIAHIQFEYNKSILKSAVQVMLVCFANVGSWREGRRTAEYSELPAHNARGTLMHLLPFQTFLNASIKPVAFYCKSRQIIKFYTFVLHCM